MGIMPVLNSRAEKLLTIPQLSGGLNLRDSPTMIKDNQLTDAKNVWFKDGILKTRPAMQKNTEVCVKVALSGYTEDRKSYRLENVFQEYKGKPTQLVSKIDTYYLKDDSTGQLLVGKKSKIQFSFINATDVKALSDLDFNDTKYVINYFLVQSNDDIYCFAAYNSQVTTEHYDVFKYSGGSWVKMSDDDMYVPTVATHCKPNGCGTSSTQDIKSNGGVMFEGYNILCDKYKMIYSTVNRASLQNDDDDNDMVYSILTSLCDTSLTGRSVIAKITRPDGQVVTHTVTLSNTTSYCDESSINAIDGLRMHAYNHDIWFTDAQTALAGAGMNDYVEDNLELIIPLKPDMIARKRIFCAATNIWYGGTSNGIFNGTRLFLGGNTLGYHKSGIYWSDTNNPLYFDENNYVFVGDSSQAVTGFGKQGDSLVIFKEKEIFMTETKSNNNITADSLIKQTVVDITASMSYFPMVQISDGKGCNCPNTIQMCKNRLVWCDTTGKVYTLVSESQYSDRNIYVVSEMIDRKLKSESQTDLKTASACKWENYYILFVKDHAYVMDYNTRGYQAPYRYDKTEDANINIPWYYWEFSGFQIERVATVGDDLIALSMSGAISNGVKVYTLKNSESMDIIVSSKQQIASFIKTKMFDFAAPAYNKLVSNVNIAFGNNGGIPISVSFITEKGANINDTTIELMESNEEPYSNEYVHSKRINALIRFCNRLGIYISCDGKLATDAISINYRVTGATK